MTNPPVNTTLTISDGASPNVFIAGDNTVEVGDPSGADRVTLRLNASITKFEEGELPGGVQFGIKHAERIGDTEVILLTKENPVAKVLIRGGFHSITLVGCIAPSAATKGRWSYELKFEKLPLDTVTDNHAAAKVAHAEVGALMDRGLWDDAADRAEEFLRRYFINEVERAVAMRGGEIQCMKGLALAKAGKLDRALATFDDAIERFGREGGEEFAQTTALAAHVEKAIALANAGRKGEALAVAVVGEGKYAAATGEYLAVQLARARKLIQALRS